MKLNLRRYRSWHELDLEIGPGITAVVGPSDQGKSNLTRAFRDICYGARPRGLVEDGEKDALAAVRIVEGTRVALHKGKDVNEYHILGPDGKKESFTKFGATLPIEISAATGFREVPIDKDLVLRPNLAEQHEPHFLLGETPSVVAKAVGSISGLHIVLAAIRDAQAEAQALDKEARQLEGEVEAANIELGEAKKKAKILSEARKRVDALEAQRIGAGQQVSDFAVSAARLSERIRIASAARNAIPHLPPELNEHLVAAEKQLERANQFRKSAAEFADRMNEIAIHEKAIHVLQHLPSEDDLLRLETMILHMGALRNNIRNLDTRMLCLGEANRKAAIHRCGFDEAEAALDAVKSCPLCGQPITKEATPCRK